MANLRLKIIHEIQNICIYYYYFSFETFLNIVEKKQNNIPLLYIYFVHTFRNERLINVLSHIAKLFSSNHTLLENRVTYSSLLK